MADHPTVDLGEDSLLGEISRIAQGTEESFAVGPGVDVHQCLEDRLVIRFGPEAELHRAATIR